MFIWESFGYQLGINSNGLPEEWQKINFEPLKKINFSEKHLLDIYETKLCDPEMVQESIYHFAFGLETQPEKYKKYDSPLTVLIGCLRKGKTWLESKYESPKERALRELIEERKRQDENKKNLINALYQQEFDRWLKSLSESEKEALLTEKTRLSKFSGMKGAEWSKYFKQNVWRKVCPKEYEEYLDFIEK